MKRWIILIISLTIIVFSGIWEIKYLENTSRYALSDLEYSKNLIENNDFDNGLKSIKSIEETWDNINTVWSIFIDHDEIESIEEKITTYKSYVKLKQKDEALVAAKELERIFYHIVDKQRVKVGNVL